MMIQVSWMIVYIQIYFFALHVSGFSSHNIGGSGFLPFIFNKFAEEEWSEKQTFK